MSIIDGNQIPNPDNGEGGENNNGNNNGNAESTGGGNNQLNDGLGGNGNNNNDDNEGSPIGGMGMNSPIKDLPDEPNEDGN